ncbi:MAG TPA: threonine dehydratase, partial [Paracoccus sp. (in: a-proteobacteria)]|nr:threonine dehydratase [Paracoccus sp. (in: a-proteobacteria)]
NFGSVLIGIETTDAANFDALNARLIAAGFDWRDITGDQVLSEFLI